MTFFSFGTTLVLSFTFLIAGISFFLIALGFGISYNTVKILVGDVSIRIG
jgi:hypothetical protein